MCCDARIKNDVEVAHEILIVNARAFLRLQVRHARNVLEYFQKGVTMNLIVTRRMTALRVLLASTLMTACGLRRTNASSETLTVYEDAQLWFV